MSIYNIQHTLIVTFAVLEAGPQVASQFAPGDHVLLVFASCGFCKLCLSGQPAFCVEGRQLNFSGKRTNGQLAACDATGQPISGLFFGQSSFSQTALVHSRSAVKLDTRSIDELRYAAALGCGVLTGASSIIHELKPSVGSKIAIWGAGPVGLAACMAAKLSGAANIIVVDTNARKLNLAKVGIPNFCRCGGLRFHRIWVRQTLLTARHKTSSSELWS